MKYKIIASLAISCVLGSFCAVQAVDLGGETNVMKEVSDTSLCRSRYPEKILSESPKKALSLDSLINKKQTDLLNNNTPEITEVLEDDIVDTDLLNNNTPEITEVLEGDKQEDITEPDSPKHFETTEEKTDKTEPIKDIIPVVQDKSEIVKKEASQKKSLKKHMNQALIKTNAFSLNKPSIDNKQDVLQNKSKIVKISQPDVKTKTLTKTIEERDLTPVKTVEKIVKTSWYQHPKAIFVTACVAAIAGYLGCMAYNQINYATLYAELSGMRNDLMHKLSFVDEKVVEKLSKCFEHSWWYGDDANSCVHDVLKSAIQPGWWQWLKDCWNYTQNGFWINFEALKDVISYGKKSLIELMYAMPNYAAYTGQVGLGIVGLVILHAAGTVASAWLLPSLFQGYVSAIVTGTYLLDLNLFKGAITHKIQSKLGALISLYGGTALVSAMSKLKDGAWFLAKEVMSSLSSLQGMSI